MNDLSPQSTSRAPRIAIIGGGPGGLALASILHLHGITSTVFERDEHPLHRPQGGTLDLHAESGQAALKAAGLWQEFQQVARYEDQGSKLYDKHGTLLFEEPDAASGDRPEIDRTELRRILIESLPADTIRWGARLRGVNPRADGTYDVVVDGGGNGTFDLVVGADGARSQVRPLVSDTQPLYSGITFFELGLDDVDRQHPDIAGMVGHGKLFAVGDAKALIAQRNGHVHVRVYAEQVCALDLAVRLVGGRADKFLPQGTYEVALGHQPAGSHRLRPRMIPDGFDHVPEAEVLGKQLGFGSWLVQADGGGPLVLGRSRNRRRDRDHHPQQSQGKDRAVVGQLAGAKRLE